MQSYVKRLQENGPAFGLFRENSLNDIDNSREVSRYLLAARRTHPEFVVDKFNEFATVNLLRWLNGCPFQTQNFDNPREIVPGNLKKGIYLAGNTGSGKSLEIDALLAYGYAAAKFFVSIRQRIRRHQILWTTIRADELCDRYQERGTVWEYIDEPLLCIHDIAAEIQGVNFMGNRDNVIERIIQRRGDIPDTMTLVTTNLPVANLPYSERAKSRLQGMCNYFTISGIDRRTGKLINK